MAICKSCNKFAANSLDNEPEADLEVLDSEFDTDSEVHVTGIVRFVLTSECCDEELKEASLDLDEHIEITRSCACEDFEAEFEGEIVERSQTTTKRTLKSGEVKETPIKNPRYWRKFYGVAGIIKVSCDCGETKAELDWSDEVGASEMEEV